MLWRRFIMSRRLLDMGFSSLFEHLYIRDVSEFTLLLVTTLK